jgi:DNA repair exonuclease SbcCD ATPase subunit
MSLRKQVDDAVLKFNTASQLLKTTRQEMIDAEEYEFRAGEAQRIIQTIASSIQEEAHSKIAGVVSRCLESIFDEPYEFKITFERKRGKTEARLSFIRDDMEIDPLSASGGGVVDVAAFALRLACLVLATPKKRKTLILDEPFKFLSKDYRENTKQMMEILSAEMGVQFIMVTHIPELVCGKLVEIG